MKSFNEFLNKGTYWDEQKKSPIDSEKRYIWEYLVTIVNKYSKKEWQGYNLKVLPEQDFKTGKRILRVLFEKDKDCDFEKVMKEFVKYLMDRYPKQFNKKYENIKATPPVEMAYIIEFDKKYWGEPNSYQYPGKSDKLAFTSTSKFRNF